MVALNAIKLDSEEDIRHIKPKLRNCLFKEETQAVNLHKEYSQANCLLECSLSFAQQHLKDENNSSFCTPWFFPFLDTNYRMCDPWEKMRIFETIQNEVPQDQCLHCLPDCNRVIYQQSISTQLFRGCDEKNFGMTDFCNSQARAPQIWATQVLKQLNGSNLNMTIVNAMAKSSIRYLTPQSTNQFIFSELSRSYDAYEKDISVLSVFFSSPTVMQFSTKQSKNWLDFISAVGGNVGLFIGFNIVTLVELIWIGMKVLKLAVIK